MSNQYYMYMWGILSIINLAAFLLKKDREMKRTKISFVAFLISLVLFASKLMNY
jgi:uncharacterized membrane protein YhaH (DUF805 family)